MDGSDFWTMPVRKLYRTCLSWNDARIMTFSRVATLLITGLAGLTASVVLADEPILQFVDGLRERQYFDTALESLDAAQQRPELSGEVRDVLDLERAKTLQAMGASSRVPEDRELYLQQAKDALEKFTSAHNDHPQAAFANSMLGELLLERARTLIWQADSADTPDKRTEYQLTARKLIDEGQKIYQTANDQFKAALDLFPKTFIDKTKDEEKYNARRDADFKYQRAWFNLIRCTYERGLTFGRKTEERRDILTNAASLFEDLHSHYREEPIGLHARLMMGKCFQEQDDLSRALGIYNEMRAHTSENESVQMLKAIALQYRLICLNDPQRNDHQIVMQESTVWLQANKARASTPYGLGILWERATAAEKLGAAREMSEKDRESTLRLALNDAATVARYQGPFRESANAMSRRIKAALGDKDKEPKDFATAFERGKNMIFQIDALTDEISAAKDDNERAQKKAAMESHLKEVGRLLQMALDLRDSDSDPKAVAQARYLQSFIMLKLGRPLDSVILARHCMIQDRAADPDSAMKATEIAMGAAVSAWNMVPGSNRDFETRLLKSVCQEILEMYPQSSRGSEARIRLAIVYRTLNEPLEAAKWYLDVPETDPQYASARISAGQSYWAAWTQRAATAAAEDPENANTQSADMQSWKTEAHNLLAQGIQITRDKIGADAKPSDELVAAEVSLASILNLDGEFQEAITRLTSGGANSVVAAIQMPEGETRPEDGIQSKSFAGLTFRLLLRAYVGTQQIEQALTVMTQLENVGGQDILAVYTQLGVELQEELRRLKQSNDRERLAQTRDSFEKFLQKVYESRNKSDYNSLLWIGETYFGLGQGVSSDAVASSGYYSKAADAYSEIISGGLATEANRSVVQLRLARCRRQQKQFKEAFEMCDEILKSNPNALDAQIEAAHVLSDWGSDSDPPKLLDAIQGLKSADGKAGHVWGWSLITRKLQQTLQREPTPEMRARFIDARYELTNCRRRYAKTNAPDGDKQLNSALAEVTSFVQVYRDLDDASFAKFDRLYQDLQADKGEAPVPLQRASGSEGVASNLDTADPNLTGSVATENRVSGEAAAKLSPVTDSPDGSGLLLGTLVTCLSLGIAGGFFVLMRKPKRRPKIPGSDKAPKFSSVTISDPSLMIPDLGGDQTPGLDFFALAAVVTTPRKTAGAATRPAGTPAGVTPSTRAAAPSTTNPAAAPRTRPSAPAAPETNAADAAKPAAPKPRPRPVTDAGAATSATPTATPRPSSPRPAPPADGGSPAESAPQRTKPAAPRPPARQTPPGQQAPPTAKSPTANPASAKPPSTKPASAPAERPPQRKPPASSGDK